MDPTYIGAYGRLKASKADFLAPDFVDQLMQRDQDEFLKSLSSTGYRKEIDSLSQLYQMPDLVEAVLNAHMMRMIRNAAFAVPSLARDFISAYVGRWDIENIKVILSSKVLNYAVENTEVFLTVQRGTPVGLFGGTITREDYVKINEQKDVEGVVNALVRFGYGTPLLKYVDEVKRTNDVSSMVLALDTFYYQRLLSTLRFYNGDEGPMYQYVTSLIDIKNITTAIKGNAFGHRNVKDYFIKGGSIPDNKLVEISTKDASSLKNEIPFKIDDAIERYRKDGLISHIELGMRRELYKKYLKLFDSLAGSLEAIVAFAIRSEIERDELRAVWLTKYYKISKERADTLRTLRYVVS